MNKKPRKVVLAYSGGLDTSIILKWLQLNYNYEVVTFIVCERVSLFFCNFVIVRLVVGSFSERS